MKSCRTVNRQLAAYIDGELDEHRARVLEAHLEGCGGCRAELEARRSALALLAETLEAAPAPETLSFWHPARNRINLRPLTLADIWFSPRFKAILATGALACLLFLITTNYVVYTVVEKQEPVFESVPQGRPRVELKKLKSSVALSRRPAARLPRQMAEAGSVMPSLELPVIAGIDGRLADADTEEFNTEQYSYIRENPFQPALQHPLSTFSIDVDRAAYANVRRFLTNDRLPPPDAVRIEEMINYFNYDYAPPAGDEPFAVSMELAECPWNPGHQLALIGLQGARIDTKDLPPNNLVFLLDVSGSMNKPAKLPLVKEAMRLLVGQLRPQDRVSIVVYAGAAGLVLEPTADKAKMLEAIDRLEAGGSTAGGAGIVLAYDTAQKSFIRNGNNRVILATDGDFNVGVSSDGDLVRLIEKKRRTGIFLSVLGFGTGNCKDAKLEQLADKGNGNYAYIDGLMEARKVLVSEMGGTLVTIAKDVKIQIEFNPAAVKAYRLVGYENRILAAEEFDDDRRDAGELGAGHSVTALYELIPSDAEAPMLETGELKYQQTRLVPSDELMTVKLRYKQPGSETSRLITRSVRSGDIRAMTGRHPNIEFASAVAEFGLLLRDSEYKGRADYERLLQRARDAKGTDEEGYRAEFIRLVERARTLEADR